MARKIETLFVTGPAGRLEALLEEPEDAEPREAALVCHPHPQHGGTMHNKVVHRVARGLRHAGCVVLRFNYRGVNLSEGVYDRGEGEVEDARAALAELRRRYPDLPFTLAGFSFGSRVICRLGCPGIGARRLIPVGFPTIYPDRDFLENCTVPRYFIQSSNDEYGPLEDLRPVVDALPDPKQLIAIPARDHFFAGGLEELEYAVFKLP
ncbi:MAG: alpha/beta hydrolase [Bryobacteraceae bacterium]|nr:alpha/beta hydrolase [Bryobacteraceae bacterium]